MGWGIQVILTKGFYMQTTEVTQGQWNTIMGNNPSNFKDCVSNCPVENVSWNDAKEFVSKLNSKEGINKYRLPTEAEWQYACQAGSKTDYANGNSLDVMGWYEKNSDFKTHPVAKKKPNAWGLFDMHGNVGEWCEDWKGSYSSGNYKDPVGPSTGLYRVNRGGSWNCNASYCRSSYRYGGNQALRLCNLGLRLVRTP
jgi:formylglycine-generating enzyme required for sulfatase activity